jgi:multiple sugar transport system permease protein
VRRLLFFLGALAVAGLFAFPLVWMAITAFKTDAEIVAAPTALTIERPTLENFEAIFGDPVDTPVARWYFNSLFTASGFALLAVTLAVLAAYPLARMEFPGRKLYIGLLLASLAIPGIVLLLPSYVIVDAFGWLDTYWVIIVPGAAGAFGVLLLRQYFVGLPVELEEAARLDGASDGQILRNVVVPLSKPPILTLLAMSFMGSWNDYFWPLITLYSPDMRTLPIGMATLQGRYVHFYGKMMAGALLIAIPSMLLFLFIQRYYINSVAQSGIK